MAESGFLAPQVAAEIDGWLHRLGAERRMSPKTVEAYRRDVLQLLAFLAGHLGGAPSLKDLAALTPADVRAFMAARRAENIGSRSLMRGLAGTRAFARYLERQGKGKVGALAAVRAPKIPKTLPRPLAVAAARRMTDADLADGDERAPWIHARDAAVLGLLYGCGLRIAESLGLRRADFGAADTLTVMGKGRKQRMVPLLPQVAKLVADYVALCPYDLAEDGPLFVGAKGGPLSPRLFSWPWRGCAACSDWPRPRRRMRCGIPSPPICWPAAAICVRSRNCSATPRCRPRKSTLKSTPTA